MRTTLSIFILIMIFAAAGVAQTAKFDPNGGMFMISVDTPAPKSFTTFVGFALITENFRKNGTAYPIKPSGVVYETGDHTLNLTNIVFNGRDLSFGTAVGRGVSYKFDGTMFKATEKDTNGNEIVMTGHLTKFLRGKKVAEVDAKFTFEEGD